VEPELKMSKTVIHVEGLGKRYRIGERERYLALRDVMARAFTAMFRRAPPRPREYLWALRDVSFDIPQGEVVGLVGRNGAGKTTLLKLLSRITRPTAGYAEVHGRVGSLLEVGTGFHPELTGRENIYLSGAVLGMSKREIDQKQDAIVDFSGVERYLDTPLKHFSTGMQMRLAFAVAAHMEPEILLVDEVLAVGDLEFQKKCLGKMQEVSRSGRTIVFVSHQMNQIRRLCERVLWIDAGQIREDGPTGQVIAAYETTLMSGPQQGQNLAGSPVFLGWELAGGGTILRDGLNQVTLHFMISPNEEVRRGHFGLHIYNDSSVLVASWGFEEVSLERGTQQLRVTVPYLPLRPGSYSILCSMFNGGNNLTGGRLLELWNAVPFLAVDTLPRSHQQDRWAGVFDIPAELSVASGGESRKEAREQHA
jgi:ABC-type polysaccharide/polyol phosphate transport system ATPase subunit